MRYDLPPPAQCTDVPLQHKRRRTDRPTIIYTLYEQNSCTGIPDVLTVIVKANDRVIIQLAAVRRRQEGLQCYNNCTPCSEKRSHTHSFLCM